MDIVKGYGNALYELAVEDNAEKRIEEELGNVVKIFKSNEDFPILLSNPRINASERIRILDDIFHDKIHPYLLILLKIIAEKREFSTLPLIYKEYQKRYFKDKNITVVTVVSAVELSKNQKQRIIEKLERSIKKSVILENRVDKTCIGGIQLKYDGHMIDASIKNRLVKLQYDIKNADYSQAEV